MNARVALVGAGPGDPGLLTLRGIHLLRRADLVLYDALVPASIVDLARRARRFYVGKRAGRHAMTQEAIHRLMIRAAARGQRVVRLKGGDPFVFGRGGEEVLALKAAGISVEVVPGISSALAAPALAGIPVTHRGVSTGIVIVSGHDESAYADVLDSVAPHAATIVVLMGVATRAAVADRLLAAGWSGATPAAIVFGAGHASAHAWTGRLDGLSDLTVEDQLPGTLVIGQVVALAPLIGGAVNLPAASAGEELERQGRG
jgi:uroporphyrin-III C-methyltransferase/precorrin-2 dehydrogenase/sirohydrochlorin ferrochelatase